MTNLLFDFLDAEITDYRKGLLTGLLLSVMVVIIIFTILYHDFVSWYFLIR